MSIDRTEKNTRAVHKEIPLVKVVVAAAAKVDTSGILKVFRDWEEENKTERQLVIAGSLGFYSIEPLVIIRKTNSFCILYANVTEERALQLIRDGLIGNNPRPDLAYCNLGNEEIESVPFFSSIPPFNIQKRIAIRNCGLIDPHDMECYIAESEGYGGLARALRMDRREALQELNGIGGEASKLTSIAGRWKKVQDERCAEKYVISKAFDADVQDQTAGFLLCGDPHSILEGSLIAAYVVGASNCIVVVAADQNGTLETLKEATKQMRARNLLGSKILDSEFGCDIEVREVPSSLMLHDERALIASLEGRQAMPSQHMHGGFTFEQKPVLIENAEALSRISAIFQKHAGWFPNSCAGAKSGSRVISVSGAVQHRCIMEASDNTRLHDILACAGVISDRSTLKAVLFGGPTGVFISPDDLDLTLNELSLAGSTIEVISSDRCIVGLTAELVSYVQKQACGECVFCREGMIQISGILRDIMQGQSNEIGLEMVAELAEAMKILSSCTVGKSAAEMVLSSLRLFRNEYELRIKGTKCCQQMSRDTLI